MKFYKNFLMMLAVVAGLSLVACSGDKDDDADDEQETSQTTNPETPTAAAQFTVNVNGMVCNTACPAAISDGYKELAGISACEASYTKETGGQITFTYDPALTDEASILEKLAGINEGQYTIVEAETPETSNEEETVEG